MPKHIFEGKDPLKFDFNPPVSIGAYKLHGFDPNGQWFTWEKREDWQRTTLARFGEPGPRYVTYVDPGPPDRRVIAQMNHELDVIHDVSPEGMLDAGQGFAVLDRLVRGLSLRPSGPDAAAGDPQPPEPEVREPRRALGAGAGDRHQGGGDGLLSRCRHHLGDRHPADRDPPRILSQPDEGVAHGLRGRHRASGRSSPTTPTIGEQIAAMLRPSMGDQIPDDPAEISAAFGAGWWKQDTEAAAELMQRAGFTRRGNDWYTPSGERFAIKLMVEGDARPVMTRAGTMIAQQWRQFGIDATAEAAQAAFLTRRNGGDFEAAISWSVETWGGHPDLSFFLDSWHSQFVQPAGKVQTPRNWSRWSSPELDKIIEEIRKISFDDPKGVELGREFVKLAVQEMPIIPLMAYNVFTVMDQTYWTGYPTAKNPYTNPVPNWSNSRYMMVRLKPTQP